MTYDAMLYELEKVCEYDWQDVDAHKAIYCALKLLRKHRLQIENAKYERNSDGS